VISLLALDLSIRSTGFAFWSDGMAKPAYGTWELAGDIDHAPRAFVRLHRRLKDINDATPIDVIAFEEAIPPHMLHGNTNAKTVTAAAGLAAHVMSFGEALGIRYRAVSIGAWRRHFIGSQPRGTKTADFKHLAMQRCRELGFNPAEHDAAEACGLLDYEMSVEGILPPWRHALQTQLRPGRAA
jgi:hypothetical protein